MSIEQITGELPEELETNERDYWKERANLMGISYPSNIPTDKLKSLVQAKLAEEDTGTRGKTYLEKLAPEVRQMHDNATALVRFRLRVLDPSKASWTGMYVTVGNDNLSPVRRAIYFIDEPWHAERILVDALKGMKYAHRPSKYESRLKGTFNTIDKPKMMPMFHVEELPPLTEQELKDLATYQAQNNTGQQEE